jgi:hypothetical protein
LEISQLGGRHQIQNTNNTASRRFLMVKFTASILLVTFFATSCGFRTPVQSARFQYSKPDPQNYYSQATNALMTSENLKKAKVKNASYDDDDKPKKMAGWKKGLLIGGGVLGAAIISIFTYGIVNMATDPCHKTGDCG